MIIRLDNITHRLSEFKSLSQFFDTDQARTEPVIPLYCVASRQSERDLKVTERNRLLIRVNTGKDASDSNLGY